MRKRPKFLGNPRGKQALVIFSALLAGAGLLSRYRGRPQSKPVGLEAVRVTDEWVRRIEREGKPGHWIVVRGTHPGDQVVAAASAATLTHAAVYDARRHEVVEAVGGGVTVTPLRELIAQARRVLLIEPRDYTPEAGDAAVKRARGHVGHAYDWLGTLGAQSDRRFYCTELCLDAYDARGKGWMPAGVIHPEAMERYGRVIFDTGPRPETTPLAEVSGELKARFAKLVSEARGVDYAAAVAPGIYRGGVPDKEGVAWLKEHGIRTVVNLRHYHGDSEGELVEAAGLKYVRIPLSSTDAPRPEQVELFLRTVTDPANQPVYVHCLHGVDRTGAMIATYRMQVQGWSNADALAEMEHFGAHGILEDLRHYVASFRPGLRAK